MTVRARVLDDHVDVARALAPLAEVEDREAGIRERFLTPTIGGGKTVAVLTTPLGEPLTSGWVVCHSYGMEQVNLATHEVPIARSLAAAGFPVLRYHGQGYGDSELPAELVDLESHVRDALDAASVLVQTTGVSQVGYLGARFGGTVAAFAASRGRATGLVMWEPVVRGRAYARSLLTLSVMLQLMHQERQKGQAPDPERQLAETGVLDVQGFPLTRRLFEDLSALDLTERLDAFSGRSLVLQVSKVSEPRPEMMRLVARIRDLGGTSELGVVADERANTFGEPRYRPVGGGTKADVQGSLGESLLARTFAWCTASGSTDGQRTAE